MNTLLSIVRNIALLALVSSFWELLAPAGRLRGPVRLVIGLLLVSCVVLPLTDALARGPVPWELPSSPQPEPQQALAEGQAIATRMGETARSQYEQDLARQISSICLLGEGVQAARAAVSCDADSGALTRVEVELELSPGAEAVVVKKKIVNLIGAFFAVGENNIDCRVKEGEEHAGEQREEPQPAE